MAIYAIGDIQGCYDELCALLTLIEFDQHRDQLWIAGDMVNRGPKSAQTLRLLMSLEDRVQCVLGNHDLHLLAVASGQRQAHRKDTFDDVLKASDKPQLIDWLRRQPLLYHSVEHELTMVHAGIPPIWGLKQALGFASEVEAVLQGEQWLQFMSDMYGNQPCTWSDTLQGHERLKVITNYFTRMRFCNAEGTLDLIDKANRDSNRDGYQAWYRFDNSGLPQNHQILFGHWAALEGDSRSSLHHALDTGCAWGGTLTAMNVNTKQRYCVAAGEYAVPSQVPRAL